jgi:hypothetical protein
LLRHCRQSMVKQKLWQRFRDRGLVFCVLSLK